MARRCKITGKGTISGNKVSHSQVKTKRTFRSNIQSKNLINPVTGEKMKVKLAVSTLRMLRKWDNEGKKYDLRELVN